MERRVVQVEFEDKQVTQERAESLVDNIIDVALGEKDFGSGRIRILWTNEKDIASGS